ncbi:hypothetical protein GGS21DRAFT_328153 [Xylaria nigripes]|nr:hypothetical protein GGS21DRAFT_328153 [Xylaria nigripes]
MKHKNPTSSSKPNSSKKPSTKRPTQKHQQPVTPEQKESPEEKARQQVLLDVFSTAFHDVLYSPDFTVQLQEVKTALYNRDFEAAFARESALAVYAARWSPTRALCYSQILRNLDVHLRTLISASAPAPGINGEAAAGEDKSSHDTGDTDTQNGETIVSESQDPDTNRKALKLLSIGGAAAELVAIVDYLTSIQSTNTSNLPSPEITLLDIAPWTPIIQTLTEALTTAAPKSPYYPQPRPALIPSLRPTITQTNILATDLAALITQTSGPLKSPLLITLLFTLNELYTTSGIKATTAFLRTLSAHAPPGTLLLVVDSPGSYAETSVGKEGRRYPMQWLLHHTLIPPPPAAREREGEGEKEGAQRWECLESHDSVWFRVAEGLRYPIALENMRYQLHLYRAS